MHPRRYFFSYFPRLSFFRFRDIDSPPDTLRFLLLTRADALMLLRYLALRAHSGRSPSAPCAQAPAFAASAFVITKASLSSVGLS